MKKEHKVCKLLGTRLRAIRKQKGMTQAEVAERAHLNDKYYSEVERGLRNITLVNLQKISGALRVPLTEIFRFPLDRSFSKEDQEIVAIITDFLSRSTDLQKHKVKTILNELVELAV